MFGLTFKRKKVPENAQNSDFLPEARSENVQETKADSNDTFVPALKESAPSLGAESAPLIDGGPASRKIEREFTDFKRKKALSRIDRLVTGLGGEAETRSELRSAAGEAKSRAVVLPRLLPVARRELPKGFPVLTVVGYPYCAGSKKGVFCEIKAAFRLKSSVAAGVGPIREKGTERMIKKLAAMKKRGEVYPMFVLPPSDAEGIGKLARLLSACGFKRVAVSVTDKKAAADGIATLYELLGERCQIDAVGDISTAEEARDFFSAGADRIITVSFTELKRKRLEDIDV